MLNLDTLQRQHREIEVIVKELKGLVKDKDVEKNAAYIAKQISLMAGKLKIHLNTEDEYMYPQLLKSENMGVRNTAWEFIDEMGHISSEFMIYKDKFNTKSKISGNLKAFTDETTRIFKILEDRIWKENASLYPML